MICFIFLRLQQQQTKTKKPTSHTASWKHKTEIEKELAQAAQQPQQPKQPTTIVKDHSLAVDGLFFTCPVYPACLPFDKIHEHVRQSLLKDLEDEPLMISVTLIHTLNRDKIKKEAAITILCKYIQNIIDHPGEEKYRKIRKGNKVFQEKVIPIVGVSEFLTKGVGFEIQSVPTSPTGAASAEGINEEFFVLNECAASNTELLETIKEMLVNAEGLEIVLDRNMRIFSPSSKATQIAVPDSFFSVKSDELKRMQAQLTETAEKSKEMRTKAMRDADSGPKKVYKYCIIRIRFPDGLLIQGTFKASEKLSDVKDFVKEQLALDWLPFDLVDSIGRPFSTETTASLSGLKLTPAAVLNFRLDQNVMDEISASSPGGRVVFLKNEVLALVTDL